MEKITKTEYSYSIGGKISKSRFKDEMERKLYYIWSELFHNMGFSKMKSISKKNRE